MSSSAQSSGNDKSSKIECATCCGLLAFNTSTTLERLIENEDAGCSLCAIIRRAVMAHSSCRPLDGQTRITLYHGHGLYEMVIGNDDSRRVKISVYGHDRLSAPLKYLPGEGAGEARPAGTITDVLGTTFSSAALDRIRGWIENCERSHKDCKLAAPRSLPTRVLDLGFQNNQLRLYETNGETERYICLSHCWGGHQPLKTSTSTIKDRKRGINWDEVPRTFQDAVVLSRALGIHYLWIDSLCIVQDDEDDWRRESAKMHAVFQGSYLTIAASWSAGPDSGLFRDVPSEYHLRDWDLNGQHLRTRRKIPHVDSVRDHPLMGRGWVFQERLLSLRVLHFSVAELAWECMESSDCECGEFNECLGLGEYQLAEKSRHRHVTDMGEEWLVVKWWMIVMEYSRTRLSFERDIFPALSGLAELQRAARSSTYLAGLWSDSFIYDLLWHVPKRTKLSINEFEYERVARPPKWRAPTWSWASIKSAVKYDPKILGCFECKLTSYTAEVGLAGESETGQVNPDSTCLEVSGLLGEVTVHRPRTSEEKQRHHTAYLRFGDLVIHFEEDYDIWGDQSYPVDDGGTLFCLFMGAVKKPEWALDLESTAGKMNWQHDRDWYMVLKRLDAEDDLYERVGVATIPIPTEEGESEPLYHGFLQNLRDTENLYIV